jgi:hypothetical protein
MHTCIEYVAKSKHLDQMEQQVIQLDQDVYVCGWCDRGGTPLMIPLSLAPLFESMGTFFNTRPSSGDLRTRPSSENRSMEPSPRGLL